MYAASLHFCVLQLNVSTRAWANGIRCHYSRHSFHRFCSPIRKRAPRSLSCDAEKDIRAQSSKAKQTNIFISFYLSGCRFQSIETSDKCILPHYVRCVWFNSQMLTGWQTGAPCTPEPEPVRTNVWCVHVRTEHLWHFMCCAYIIHSLNRPGRHHPRRYRRWRRTDRRKQYRNFLKMDS